MEGPGPNARSSSRTVVCAEPIHFAPETETRVGNAIRWRSTLDHQGDHRRRRQFTAPQGSGQNTCLRLHSLRGVADTKLTPGQARCSRVTPRSRWTGRRSDGESSKVRLL